MLLLRDATLVGNTPDRSAERFRLRTSIGAGVGAFALGFASFLGMLIALRKVPPSPLSMALLFGVPLIVGAFSAWWRKDAEVIVGADGVWVGRPLRYRFIPVQDLAEVVLPDVWETKQSHPPDVSLRLVLTSGERVELVSFDGMQLRHVGGAIRGMMDARETLRARALTQLERKGRTLTEWRAALRGLSESSAGFRDAAISRDQIEAALEDATLPAEQRLGAAIALGETGGADRVRIAAEASAEPRMRVVLSRIAGGLDAEDEALFALLDEDAAAGASDATSSA